jgi:hypothetical protein
MQKINELLQQISSGAVISPEWLATAGVSSDRARKLANGGWLQRVGHGAYGRKGDRLTWEGGVYGLQFGGIDTQPRFWPGGASALALAGFAHYLNLGGERIHIYGEGRVRLPRWFVEGQWGVGLEFHAPSLFAAGATGFADYTPPGRDFVLHISTPERAILEWLAVEPDELLFDSNVVDTFKGLSTLRPRSMQQLLVQCRSVRVKRVFLLLAREAGHAWYGRLELDQIDLGKGKRQLVVGGKLDRQFQITVPETFANGV